MIKITLKKEWIGVSALLLYFSLMGGNYIHNGLQVENRLTAVRIAHAFIPLLTKAHSSKDDLVLQEVVSAMAQAPGIVFACITDADDKVLANTRLTQIGKHIELPYGGDRIHSFPLKEESVRWGTLTFSLSETSTHKLWITESPTLLIFGLFLCFLYGIRLYLEERRLKKLRQALEDQTALWNEEKRQKSRLEHTLSDSLYQSKLCYKSVLEKIPEPMILLDSRQRLAAFNHLAAEVLDLSKNQNWDNATWQDIPWLCNQGKALGDSLQSPGVDITIDDDRNGTIRTEELWTWVRPRPVLRACR
jgi:hypothetical protein